MAERRTSEQKTSKTRRRPARTPTEREQQLVGRAMDLAEQQLMDGTASAQVITHFLKIGTEREKLERARIEAEVELSKGKLSHLGEGAELKKLYNQAMQAFSVYSGSEESENGDDQEI